MTTYIASHWRPRPRVYTLPGGIFDLHALCTPSSFHPTFLLPYTNPFRWRSADQRLELEEVGRAQAGDLEITEERLESEAALLMTRGEPAATAQLTGSQPVPAVKPFVLQPGLDPDVMSLKPVAPVE